MEQKEVLWNSVFRNVFLIIRLTACIFHAVLGRLSRKCWVRGRMTQERMTREGPSSEYQHTSRV